MVKFIMTNMLSNDIKYKLMMAIIIFERIHTKI